MDEKYRKKIDKKVKKIEKQKRKEKNNTKANKLMKIMLTSFVLFALLIGRLFYLQFVQGSYLKEKAYKQQTVNRIISPKRGTIYDASGKKLAISAPVDTVTINPNKIKGKNDEKTKELKEKLAKAFSEIFELDYEEALAKVNSSANVETIAKKVEQDKIDQLKKWMEENKFTSGINIDEDSKRYYPYNNLASHVLGFCGSDNQGLEGIELKWNNVLTGTPGKITTSTDAVSEEIPDQNQQYIAVENGSDIILSIDYNVQSVVEKYLKAAVEEHNPDKGGTAIVMNPNTGDILAMASYPDYNLNDPYTINNEALAKTWDTLDSETKTANLQAMWRNRVVSDGYEPGSTFKILNAAIALEEGITTTDKANDFYCHGHEVVADRTISCWSQNHQGPKTLREALEFSCNPSFIQLGQRIGAETMYKYYNGFGLFEKTGIALPGESNSSFWSLEDVKSVQLATMSFGQRFTITPIQLITAISSVVNDGNLMQPRIVKQIVNPDTNVTTDIEPVQVRQVISKETSEKMRDMMSSVVTDGTGKLAAVKGYSIGGKSGTSEPPDNKKEEGYVASFVGIAPADNPEVVVLVALYGVHGKNHQGGQVTGPVVSQILTDILPYLGMASSDAQASTSSSSNNDSLIMVPDIRNKTATEAEKILKSAGFSTSSPIKGDKNTALVTDQVPKPGTSLKKGSLVYLYSDEYNVRVSVTVPSVKGMSSAQATNALKSKNLNIVVNGSGTVVSQDPAADATVEEGSVVTVTLKENLKETH